MTSLIHLCLCWLSAMYSLSFLQSIYRVFHQSIKISHYANLNATPNAHDVVSHIQKNLEALFLSTESHQNALITAALTTNQRTPLVRGAAQLAASVFDGDAVAVRLGTGAVVVASAGFKCTWSLCNGGTLPLISNPWMVSKALICCPTPGLPSYPPTYHF